MNSIISELTKSITGKPGLSDCSADELKQIAGHYPYFGPAQLLYLRKMKDDNSSLQEIQKQKALLYFTNPHWLALLLNENSTARFQTDSEEHAAFREPSEPGTPVIIEPTPEPIHSLADQNPGNEEKSLVTNAANEPDISPVPTENFFTEFKFRPIDPYKAAMTFEPYHTIDYFASQGIKAKEEERPKDRFSQQLKSFTEWLKEMKRLPVTEITASVSPAEESKVAQMAAVSVNDRNIVTEAMAAVWEKQGNYSKAIEVYEKLSLLNPGKNSFFAAKIEHLKTL